MALEYGKEVTLTLTVNESFDRAVSRGSDEGYSSSSPVTDAMSTLPMTVPEETQSVSPVPHEGWKFRLPWSGHSHGVEHLKRLEKEKEADNFIYSLRGRSLKIQRTMIEKVLNKEKRRVKFGLASNKSLDLAIRRYSFKYDPPQII
jgi:hypothetical protein